MNGFPLTIKTWRPETARVKSTLSESVTDKLHFITCF